MSDESQNINELLATARKYDDLKRKHKALVESLKELEKFFSSLTPDGIRLFDKYNEDNYYDWPSEIRRGIQLLLSKDFQSYQLIEERKRYQKEYLEQLSSLEKERENLGQQLTEAWEKFRAIKTRRFQQTLREIDEENLELEKRAKIPAYRKIKERMEKSEENKKEV